MMLRLRFNRTVNRALVYCGICTFIFASFSLIYREDILELPDRWHGRASSFKSPAELFRLDSSEDAGPHPIQHLITGADQQFDELIAKKTHGVSEAAEAYRKRRGRHPPPLFDQWVAFAESKGSIIIEDFFDQIYHDLNPFWAQPPNEIRAIASNWEHKIMVRNGSSSVSNNKWHFVRTYADMVKQIQHLLPDVDLAINEMDEPRVLVPWDTMSFYMGSREATVKSHDPLAAPTVNEYSAWESKTVKKYEHQWAFLGPYWNFFRAGCPPESGAKRLVMDYDATKPPRFASQWPNGSYNGFVQNWTTTKDPCTHPHLRNLNGAFVEPISQASLSKLIPVFGGYKLSVNNDILLPSAYQWRGNDRSAGRLSSVPWEKKREEVAWRGPASGGRNRINNWSHFHRHRFVSMLNGTQVDQVEERLAKMEPVPPARRPLEEGSNLDEPVIKYELPQNFPQPDDKLYPLKSTRVGRLGDWISSFANVAFESLVCFPATSDGSCSYTNAWYTRRPGMSTQHLAKHKIIPDIDGNQVSERYREILQSNSVPIKATIWTEWHDGRLVPWKHFVPMDNTYVDMWSILEFLFEHDDYARGVAHESRWWAEQVLRKEDMLVYVYRLILEYARVSDVRRHEMGYNADLQGRR